MLGRPFHTNFKRANSAISENSLLSLMKNSIDISDNANLILNTYNCFFFQTAAENVGCCWTTSTMQDESARQRSVEMERFWNLLRSKCVNL